MITVDFKQFNAELKKLRKLPEERFPDIRRAFGRFMGDLQNQMIQQSKGKSVNARSGELSRSWLTMLQGTNLRTLVAEVFTTSKYARIHQFGGVIRPKRAKYLTIPTKFNQTPRGNTRTGARHLVNSFVKRSKKGNLLIFQSQPSGDIKPMFVLKKQVTIPKRLTFFEQAEKLLAKLFAGLR